MSCARRRDLTASESIQAGPKDPVLGAMPHIVRPVSQCIVAPAGKRWYGGFRWQDIDEMALRLVESMEPLHAMRQARPAPPIRARAAPTRSEALQALQKMEGASSAFKRAPALDR